MRRLHPTVTCFVPRREGSIPAAEDQAAALPDPDQPGGLHIGPAVRRARALRRAAAVPAAAAEHHVADDRADPVRQALRRRARRQPAAGDAARRSVFYYLAITPIN